MGFDYTGGPLLTFFRLWKNIHVRRKPCKWRSDLVLNGQMRAPKKKSCYLENVLLENPVSRGLPVVDKLAS